MLAEKGRLEQRRTEVKAAFEVLIHSRRDAEQGLQSIAELYEYMEQVDGQGRIDLRTSLREQLRRLIKKVKINPIESRLVIFFRTEQRRVLTLKKV